MSIYQEYILPKKLDRSIIEETMTFFSTRKMRNMPLIEPFREVGVYGLYYFGDSEYYSWLIEKNKTIGIEEKYVPIYIGKAVPEGSRTARPQITNKSALFGRLKEHADSIQDVKNLDINHFKCKFVILKNFDIDLIVPLESYLIRYYTPLWNSCVSGFGIHDPGEPRKNQKKSQWDTIHPGRPFTNKLTNNHIWPEEKIRQKILKFTKSL